jgi:zinc protease
MVDRYLGDLPAGQAGRVVDFPRIPGKAEKLRMSMPEAPQSSIRIGRQLFNRNHPDAAGFYILDTLIGGYFGSRLMTNIREDKGFTYNIESSFDPMRFDGCWYIECEVAHEAVEETLTEIYREMDELRSRLVPATELRMLKGYLLGNYLTMVDGPFATGELLRSVLSDGLDMTAFDELVRVTREISAADLMQLAQRYLHPDDCWEVIVAP